MKVLMEMVQVVMMLMIEETMRLMKMNMLIWWEIIHIIGDFLLFYECIKVLPLSILGTWTFELFMIKYFVRHLVFVLKLKSHLRIYDQVFCQASKIRLKYFVLDCLA